MKLLKKIVLGFVILVAVLLGIGFLLPAKYKVERSVVIQAPVEVVFDQVNDLKKNEAWSPWKDPTMKITYSENTVGKGAVSSWESKDMGNGSQTIEASVPNQSITTYLDFKEMGHANAHWTFVQEGEGVKVTQAMTGDQGMNPVKRYFGLMMDKMIGSHFETGLASLKRVSEERAAAIKAEEAASAMAAAAEDSTAAPAAAPVVAPTP
jgi:uncharacterized protein YndB with AHSA1/START domain